MGLTERQFQAVENYGTFLDGLIEKGPTALSKTALDKLRRAGFRVRVDARAVARRGMSREMADKLLDAYRKRLMTDRAVTVTESVVATLTNRGKELQWQRMIEAGELSPDVMRVWLTRKDELVCKYCRPMHGVKAPVGQPFETPLGPVTTPNRIHPRCRCGQKLVTPKGTAPLPQISYEATPHPTTGLIPGIQAASYKDRQEYLRAMERIIHAGGLDRLAAAVGIRGRWFEAPGLYEGAFNPGIQIEIDEGVRRSIEQYSAALGKALHQQAVGYHRPFFDENPLNDNGLELGMGGRIGKEDMLNLYNSLKAEVGAAAADAIALVPSRAGVRALNFSDMPPRRFQEALASAAEEAIDENMTMSTFDFEGDLISNDWEEYPRGKGYDQKISEGPPDLQRVLEDIIARVAEVNEEYAERKGWGT